MTVLEGAYIQQNSLCFIGGTIDHALCCIVWGWGKILQIFNLLAIAVALAMDAFAVAIATGVNLKIVSIRQTFRLSWHFGFFQAMMPVIGWSAGLTVRAYIEQSDHWVAFGLLVFVGGNMIREFLRAMLLLHIYHLHMQ